MGLIGKNGAGKSTTLKSYSQHGFARKRERHHVSQEFLSAWKECKQRIGVVFGGIDFYPLKKLSTITAVTRKFYTNWDETQYQKYIKRFTLNESKNSKNFQMEWK